MKSSAILLVSILIVSSILLPTAALKQEGIYAQNSARTTNATVLSSNEGNSQSELQNKSVNYYGSSSGYLVYHTSSSRGSARFTSKR
jgi:hypothetical protein